MGYKSDYSSWPEYVSVAERKAKAADYIKKSEKKGQKYSPVIVNGRTIAKTFWGKAWCENLETYSDYESRLPRGRTYVRNGSVIDLQITKGKITAQVMGSELYRISITIEPLPARKWEALIKGCAGKIDSLIELLQGKFSKSVMEIITQKNEGLFPNPKEISMKCSCPDSARMCKHIAAVLYGIGTSLDSKPEDLFVLRHVEHTKLISSAGKSGTLLQGSGSSNTTLEDSELSALFGIEMDIDASITSVAAPQTSVKPKRSAKTIKAADDTIGVSKKTTKVKVAASKAKTKSEAGPTKASAKASVAKVNVAKASPKIKTTKKNL